MLGKNTSHHKFLALLCANQQHRATVMVLRSVRPSVRPSVVDPSSVHPVFSETVKRINAKFNRKLPVHHTPRPFCCFDFYKFYFFKFIFLWYVLVFTNMGPYGRKKYKATFPLKIHIRLPPPPKKISCILLQRFSTKVVEIIVTFETLNFESFSFVGRLTW